MKRFAMILMLVAGMAPLAGCIVAPGPGPGYYHRHWVGGYYGPGGAWHPGHWS